MRHTSCLRAFRLLALLSIVSVLDAERSRAAEKVDKPAVYLIPFSHLDFFWGGTREECLARGNRIIAQAIRLAKQSPEFRFLIEDEDFVANYVESHQGTPELRDLKQLVKEGQIEITPKWAAIFQTLPDGEVLARNLVYGKRYAREVFGVDPQVVQMSDIPGFTPQFPQILQQSGVPFMVMTRMGPSDKSLFYWKAPDGSKELVWNTLKGYGWGTFLTSTTFNDEQKRKRFEKEVADVRATTSVPVYMNWGTDLWAPPDNFVKTINGFNAQAQARLVIATPSEYFVQVDKTPHLAEVSGEIPNAWPNITISLAHMWPLTIPATSTLLSAEKFATINYALGYAEYPQQEFDFLWKKLIESEDHNHDGQGGALGDNRKIQYDQLAVVRGGEILRDSLRNIAERVQIPFSNSFPVVVFNPMGWSRDDVVKTHLTLFGKIAPADISAFRKGIRLLDETGNDVPYYIEQYSENISRALDLVFIAHGVPSLGYKTYYVLAAETPSVFPTAATVQVDDDKDRQEPRRSLGKDEVENSFYRLTVDKATGRVTLFDKDLNQEVCRDMEISAHEERGGNYISTETPTGRTLFGLVDEVRVEQTNCVCAAVRVSSHIADIPITQRLILYQDLKRLDIENTIEWKGPHLLRIEQTFPLAKTNMSVHYGIPFGENEADNIMAKSGSHAADEIPAEIWKRTRLIHDWVRADTSNWGLTITTDHQQIRLGGDNIGAEMLRGTKYTSAKVVRDGETGSLHYPPPGTYVFHYSLSSSPGDWKTSKAYRAGLNSNSPLLPVEVVDEISSKMLPPSQSFCSLKQGNLVISALKKSDLDLGVVLRTYEMEGVPVETPVQFLGRSGSFREVNLLEENQGPIQHELRAHPFSIRTIKFDLVPVTE